MGKNSLNFQRGLQSLNKEHKLLLKANKTRQLVLYLTAGRQVNYRQIYRQTDRKTDGWMERQTDGQVDGWIKTEPGKSHVFKYMC